MQKTESNPETEVLRTSGLEEPSGLSGVPHVLSILIALVLILVSLAAGYTLRTSEESAAQAAVKISAQHIRGEIAKGIDQELHAVVLFGFRWEWPLEAENSAREREARGVVEGVPSLQAIQWIDVDSHSVARVAASPAIKNVFNIEGFSEIYAVAAESMAQNAVIQLRTLPGDEIRDTILIALVPIFRDGQADGILLAHYDLAQLIDNVLKNESPGYTIRVSNQTGLIWSNGENENGIPFKSSQEFSSNGLEWEVNVGLGPEIVTTYRTWTPILIAAGGSLVAILLAFSVDMAMQLRRRALSLEAANRKLRQEMELRSQAEVGEMTAKGELQEILEALPISVWSRQNDDPANPTMLQKGTLLDRLGALATDSAPEYPEAWLAIVHPDDLQRVSQIYEDVINGDLSEAEVEYRVVSDGGRLRHMADSIRSIPSDSGKRVSGITRDVTEKKEAELEHARLEARFQQTQKLESLGVMAGGIAHDFNNLLVGILGHAGLLQEDLSSDSTARSSVRSIEKAARSAADLCRQMLAYAGKAPYSMAPFDISKLVQEMGDLLRVSVPASSKIEYKFGETPAVICGDTSQVQQIVLNLITNAAESIEGSSGSIVLSVSSKEYSIERLDEMNFGEELSPGRYISISVKDNGCGMDEETKHRLFEPFYTTKFAGRGLGLAAVLGIVRGHGGAVHIQSEPGEGTEINVIFPADNSAVVPDLDIVGAPRDPHGGGKVLLVEDEEAAREFASIVLTRAKYDVVEAKDGLEAIELFVDDDRDIKCIVLDLTMPNMDGEETLEKLQAIRPSIPVVLCSGYPEKDAIARFVDRGLAGFLQKPYSHVELISCVESAMKLA